VEAVKAKKCLSPTVLDKAQAYCAVKGRVFFASAVATKQNGGFWHSLDFFWLLFFIKEKK
jgi:hypothetical protein